MVSNLFFYQVVLIALVWLFLMLSWLWPAELPAGWRDTTSCVCVSTGRRLQLGEGGHSNENPVRFWNLLPEVPKEAEARCYALLTAYATMIRLCNSCCACWQTPAPSRR
jgi:hypothetical protein